MSSQATHPRGHAPVCITGMGLCLPLGRSAMAVTQALLSGHDAIGPVRSVDASGLSGQLVSEFDPSDRTLISSYSRPFQLDAAQVAALDRAAWFALCALQEALLQARWAGHPFAAHRIGIVLGSSHAGIGHIERCFLAARAGEPVPPAWRSAAGTGHAASVIARCLGADGPRAVVSSACASSNTAVGIGMDWLVHDLADAVVVIGADTVSPSILAGFSALRALSARPSAPFSTPPGITLGEGAGVLVLEREAAARARGLAPRAWVRGYGLSGDAHHETAPDTEGHGVEAAMRQALRDAGLAAAEIDYVSAHGTGTEANDRPEAMATARVVGTRVPLSSLKSSLGHTLGASGAIELIVTCLMMREGFVPATSHFEGVRPGCPDLDYVPGRPRPLPVRHFLCNNFGFGGNNSSLVISRASGPCAHRGPLQDVVLVGQGAVGGFGVGVQSLVESLWSGCDAAGRQGGTALPADVLSPRSVLAGLDLPGNRRMSTLIRSAMAASVQALAQAGGPALVLDAPGRCALVAGIDHGALLHVEKFMASVFDDGLPFASATHFPLTTLNAAAGQVSIAFGIKGCNTTFCGAGAALHYAHSLVRDGRQDRALMLAADEFSSLLGQALSGGHDEASPRAIPGEGGGALLVESACAARLRGRAPLARLRSVAGSGASTPDQAAPALTRAMRLALEQAGRTAQDVGAVIGIAPEEDQRTDAQRQALARSFSRRVPTAWVRPVTGAIGCTSLPLEVILAAEVLRRQTLPPLRPGRSPLPLGPHACVVVVHAGQGGEVHALVLESTEAEGSP